MSRQIRCRADRAATGWAIALALSGAQAQPSDDAAFVARLHRALQPLNAAALADLSALPWTFEGRGVDRVAFEQKVVPALFTPAVRRCLKTQPPQREGEALVFACRPYGFVARRSTADGAWRLQEFFVDVE